MNTASTRPHFATSRAVLRLLRTDVTLHEGERYRERKRGRGAKNAKISDELKNARGEKNKVNTKNMSTG